MKNELQQAVLNAAERPANALIASGGTAATGASTYLQLVPEILGAIASVVGIVVSLGLFYFSLRRDWRETRKANLEEKILIAKEKASKG